MCVHSWTHSLKMSLYVEIASKQHLTPIAASTIFSNDCRPVLTQSLCVSMTFVLLLVYFHVVLFYAASFHAGLCWAVLRCWCCAARHVILGSDVSSSHFLLCFFCQQDADRSTASHPEVKRSLSLKKEPLTTFSNKAGEGDSVGCNHTVWSATSTCLSDTVLIWPADNLTPVIIVVVHVTGLYL